VPIVVDVSVTAVWAFQDEQHPIASAALDLMPGDGALAPSLWWYELRNVLLVNELRRRLTSADTAEFLRDLAELRITIDTDPIEDAIFTLARRHRLTFYDAAYLELALRSRSPLATLDDALAAAARAERAVLVTGR
jgi:predicted nucleic acid-binding protein